jgi:hypothetical protein
MVPPPTKKKRDVVEEPESTYRSPVKINYLELEQSNRIIGLSGEKLVIDYERGG